MKIQRTKYGKSKPELLKSITTEKIKLNQTEVEFIKALTENKQAFTKIYGKEYLSVDLPQWKIRQEVDALNDFDLQARKTIRVAGYEKERKNSNVYMPKALGTEIKKQNKKIDQRTAQILSVTLKAVNQEREGKELTKLRASNIDFEKVAKIIKTENSQNRAYAPISVTAKLPKNMSKIKKRELKKKALEKSEYIKEQVHTAKTTAYKDRQRQGRENLIKMLENGGFPRYYINLVKKFTNTQITMVFASYEFLKYGSWLFYDEDTAIRIQATEMLEFIAGERENLKDKKKQDDSTLINAKDIKENKDVRTSNTMRKGRKKGKK